MTGRRSVTGLTDGDGRPFTLTFDLELLTLHVFRQCEEAGAGEGKPTQEVKLKIEAGCC